MALPGRILSYTLKGMMHLFGFALELFLLAFIFFLLFRIVTGILRV